MTELGAKARPPAHPRHSVRALAERREVLLARSQALRTAFELEVREIDQRVGQRVSQTLYWLGQVRRVAGIGALVLPLLLSRRRSRRGLARGVHVVSRALCLAPLALGLVQSVRRLLQHRRAAAAAPDAAHPHD